MPRELCFGFGLFWLGLTTVSGSQGLGCTLWPQLSSSRCGVGRGWEREEEGEGEERVSLWAVQAFSRKNSMAKKKSKNVVVVTVVVVFNCMYSQKSHHRQYRQRILRSRCVGSEQTAEKDERPLWRLPLMIEVAYGCTLSIALCRPDQTRHSPRHIPSQIPPVLAS